MTQAAEEQYTSQPLHSRTSYKCLQQMGILTPRLTSLKLTFLQPEIQALYLRSLSLGKTDTVCKNLTKKPVVNIHQSQGSFSPNR